MTPPDAYTPVDSRYEGSHRPTLAVYGGWQYSDSFYAYGEARRYRNYHQRVFPEG